MDFYREGLIQITMVNSVNSIAEDLLWIVPGVARAYYLRVKVQLVA